MTFNTSCSRFAFVSPAPLRRIRVASEKDVCVGLHLSQRGLVSGRRATLIAAPVLRSAESEEADPEIVFDEDDFFEHGLTEDDESEETNTRAPISTAPVNLLAGFFSTQKFLSFGFDEATSEVLVEMGITNPTTIQARTFPAILGGASCIIGAATGSGKTLAYLLPVLQRLKVAELEKRESTVGLLRRPKRPRAIVMVPTRELAEQVLSVAKKLSHKMKFRAVGLIGGVGSLRKQREELNRAPVDIAVVTTGRLIQHLEVSNVDLSQVKHVIIDEVDTMFDKGFGPEITRVLTNIKRRQSNSEVSLQFVVAGATHPTEARILYNDAFPEAKWIEADLHRVPPGLTQRFIDVKTDGKVPEMLSLLGNVAGTGGGALGGGRTIVFCNTVKSCRFVDHMLQEAGYSTSCVHGDMPPEKRDPSFQDFKDTITQIMVCTDVAARGLDNLLVDHVVLFDFPKSPVEYLHRAGRTARGGAKGRVTALVTKKDSRLAATILEATKSKIDALERVKLRRREEEERQRVLESKKSSRDEELRMQELADRDLAKFGPRKSGRRGRTPSTSNRTDGRPSSPARKRQGPQPRNSKSRSSRGGT